jgi:anoctamin-10
MSVLLITLMASHGYLLLRVLVAHIIERMVWTESADVKGWERSERDVKRNYLQNLEENIREEGDDDVGGEMDEVKFWEREEGLGEIQKIGKRD